MSHTEHQHEHLHSHTHYGNHEEFAVHECDGAGHQHHHHEDGSCCCEQHAKEFHGIDKPMLIRLIISAALYLAGTLLPVGEMLELLFMVLSAIVAGYDIVIGAIHNVLKGHFFDEYFLMSFAAIAAFIIGETEEGAAVFLLYRIGAFCQSYAIRHSRRTIAGLTGECEHEMSDGKISNRFITKFARIYTPVVLIMSILIAVLLPIFTQMNLKDSVYRALTFLVLACPCAIVISVPMAYFAGIGAASRKGIYFSNSAAVDEMAVNQHTINEFIKNEINGNEIFCCKFEKNTEEPQQLVLKKAETIDEAKAYAKKTRLVAMENIWFTIIIKVAVLILSVAGVSALWFAVFADSGVTVLVVLNALRAYRPLKTKNQ